MLLNNTILYPGVGWGIGCYKPNRNKTPFLTRKVPFLGTMFQEFQVLQGGRRGNNLTGCDRKLD